MNWDELIHNNNESTCVCKDSEAHRAYCLEILRKRMEFLDRLRKEWGEIHSGGAALGNNPRVGVDFNLIPRSLTDAIGDALGAWGRKDRAALGFSLVDLAALSMVILEEICHWNIDNEPPGLLADHLRRLAAQMGEKTTAN